MENNNEQITQELEQMRQQLEILNRKLDNEMEVHMHQVHKYMDKVDAEMWRNIRMPLILTPFILINMINMGSSWWVSLFLLMLMGHVVCCNIYIRRLLHAKEWYIHKNLVETRQHVVKAHRLYCYWRFFDLLAAMVWLMLFCYDLSLHKDPEHMQYVWWGIAVGLLIGVPIGVYKFVRTSRHWDNLLRNIHELEADN